VEDASRNCFTDSIDKQAWRFAWRYLWRAIVVWSPSIKTLTGAQAVLGLAFNGILLLFAAASIFTHRQHWHKILPIHIVILAFTLGYSSAAAITRFRLPLYPLLEILAAGGMLPILKSRFNFSLGAPKARGAPIMPLTHS